MPKGREKEENSSTETGSSLTSLEQKKQRILGVNPSDIKNKMKNMRRY
jgi:hypothetical protein